MDPDKRKQVRRLSRLESLPVEIIQNIFFHCLEINLPRASIHIANALSCEAVYTWLVRVAFSSANDGSKKGFFTKDYLPAPLDFFALSMLERQALQSAILECRWCTLPLIRQCQKEYLEHVIRRKCADLIISPPDRAELHNVESHFSRLSIYDQGVGGRRSKGDFIVAAKTPDTNAGRRIAVWYNFGSLQIRQLGDILYDRDVFQLPCSDIDFLVRMPDKLLGAPWTPAKLEFLRLLATTAYIDEDGEYKRSKRVLREVILGRDFKTFQRLTSMYIRNKVYKYPMRWPLTRSHFRLVVRCADPGVDLFARYLVNRRWSDIPTHDVQLKEALLACAGQTQHKYR